MIQTKRECIGAESIDQRCDRILDCSSSAAATTPLAIRVPLLGAQLADLAGDAAQHDGNLITPAIDVLANVEGAFNQLLVTRDQFDLTHVKASVDRLKG